MKRFAIAALAFSVFAGPALQTAQAASPQAQTVQYVHRDAQNKKIIKKQPVKKHAEPRKKQVETRKKQVERRHDWKRGQKYSSWKNHRPVSNYRSYGLKRPPQGQQWIRVGNDYLLVSIATGLIFGAIAASR